jgi:general secretion pathway protein K
MLPTKARGLALVMVLWGIALIGVVVTSQLRESRASVRAAALARDSLHLRAAVEAEIYRTISAMLVLPTARGFTEPSIVLTSQTTSERSKVDLNGATPDSLKQVLAGLVLPEEAATITARILDWRDNDEITRLEGAEATDYITAGLPSKPRNGPFAHVDELSQVMGVSPQLISRLAAHFTVYSGAQYAEHEGAGLTTSGAGGNDGWQVGDVYSIDVRATVGGSRIVASVKVAITPDPAEPYRILAWEWRTK